MERHSNVIALSERAMNIGAALLRACPRNDCEVYRNLYTMRAETLDALEQMEAMPAKNWGRETLIREANRLARELERMARTNYAVRNFAADQRRLERQEGEA
nr:MAG TPA: hypothetical protein [Caudoviricetes sp.]